MSDCEWEGVFPHKPKKTEFWANVMVCEGLDGRLYSGFGRECDSADLAEAFLNNNRNANRFRIHVRLKPEGAPRRYASQADRCAWEIDPAAMRRLADTVAWHMGMFSSPRTPKIEESAS